MSIFVIHLKICKFIYIIYVITDYLISVISCKKVIKVYHLLAHGRWFSPGTPASSTTKTARHDIAEILLKVALTTKNQIKSIIVYYL